MRRKILAMVFSLVLVAGGAQFSLMLPDKQINKLVIVMYHSIRENEESVGEYVVTKEQLQQDIEYIKKRGYHPVRLKDLIDCARGGKKLPSKSILITFDDGYYNTYLYAYPLLKREKFPFVLSVIGSLSEKSGSEELNPAYSHVGFREIGEMAESGYVELANHSYNLHTLSPRRGILKLDKESMQEYTQMLRNDVMFLSDLLEKHTGLRPIAFTYPFGCVDEVSKTLIEDMGFLISFGCEEGINCIQKGSDLFDMKRYNRAYGKTSEDFFDAIFSEYEK